MKETQSKGHRARFQKLISAPGECNQSQQLMSVEGWFLPACLHQVYNLLQAAEKRI